MTSGLRLSHVFQGNADNGSAKSFMPLWHPHKQVKSIKTHPAPSFPGSTSTLAVTRKILPAGNAPSPSPRLDRTGVENFAGGKHPLSVIPRLGRSGVQENSGQGHSILHHSRESALVSKKILAGGSSPLSSFPGSTGESMRHCGHLWRLNYGKPVGGQPKLSCECSLKSFR